jgi:hypothetical protein
MTTQTWSAFAIASSAFVVLGIGLVYCIMNLVRSNRQDILASVPLVTEQEISLTSGGDTLVMIETPRTSIDYRALQIQLIDKQTGQAFALSYSLVTAQGAVYAFTTMQVPFGRINAQAGVYAARITGMQPGKDYSDYRLIVSRPYMGRIVLQVLGIVLCGIGLLLSLIWAAWRAGWLKAAQT